MNKYGEDIKKYIMTYDIHTHTTFSHGKGSIEDNVRVARTKGLSAIGIADHGPGHLFYGVKRKNFPVMREEINRLRAVYDDIEILLGIEANIINPSGRLDLSDKDRTYLDYVLAGYHYGIFGEKTFFGMGLQGANLLSQKLKMFNWKRLKIQNTELIIKALYENQIKVLTHPGDKALFDLEIIAKACVENEILMEISTWHEAPTLEELKKLSDTKVRFIISSDAHYPERVGTFVPGLKRALKAGIDPARIDNVKEV